jgi:hypothetical protein
LSTITFGNTTRIKISQNARKSPVNYRTCTELVDNKTPVEKVAVMLKKKGKKSCMVINVISIFRDV